MIFSKITYVKIYENVNFIIQDKLKINLGKTYAKLGIFLRFFVNWAPGPKKNCTVYLQKFSFITKCPSSQYSDKIYAGRVACCPLVSHVDYAPRALLTLEKMLRVLY